MYHPSRETDSTYITLSCTTLSGLDKVEWIIWSSSNEDSGIAGCNVITEGLPDAQQFVPVVYLESM
jgi:hypothetical protein